VENVEGCDFSVDGIDALLVVLNARPAGWTWSSGRHGRADELEIGSIEVEATGTV